MISVSNTIKNSYNNFSTQRKSYIKVGNTTFFIQNLNIQGDCFSDGNVIGNAIAKIAKFDIETQYVSNIDEFELFDGIWTGSEYEYVNLGTFKLTEEKGTDDFFSSIVSYDKLLLFNKTFNPDLVVYPLSIYELLVSICFQANVELENMSIVNGNKILDSNPFVEGETLKEILKAICQISGNYGIISNDKLKLLLRGTDTLILNKSQISDSEFKRTTWNINQVVLGMKDIEGEYVKYPDDSEIIGAIHKLVINDNPFVYTQQLREAYIQEIYGQVNGFGYEAFSTKWEGLPYVEIGDMLNIDGHNSMVLRYNLKSPNGLDSNLEAPSIIDSVVDYIDNSDSVKSQLKKSQIIVDKKLGLITSAVAETRIISDNAQDTANEASASANDAINIATNKYQEILGKLNDYASTSDVIELEKRVQTNQTNSEYAIDVIEDIKVNGVSKVQTSVGFKFDNDGMSIDRTGADTGSLINETGVNVKDKTGTVEKSLMFAGVKDGMGVVETDNLKVERYLIISNRSRFEQYLTGVGCFSTGGGS